MLEMQGKLLKFVLNFRFVNFTILLLAGCILLNFEEISVEIVPCLDKNLLIVLLLALFDFDFRLHRSTFFIFIVT